jgi:UBX domain-containing protein 1
MTTAMKMEMAKERTGLLEAKEGGLSLRMPKPILKLVFQSGISVQNPGRGGGGPVAGGDIVRNLLRQAAAGGMAAPPQPQERPRAFFGGGHVLGSEDTESSFVPDPNAKPEEEDGQLSFLRTDHTSAHIHNSPFLEVAIRHITLWRNGFQIGHDGELRTYDDPQNSALLQAINDG